MKLLLTEEEMKDVVASQSLEVIEMSSKGGFLKWDINKTENGYTLKSIYDEVGNLKNKFAKRSNSE